MKQIIIFLLIIIVVLIGYGKYSQYKRYNSPGVDYITDKKVDLEYHDQEILMKYHESIEDLNGFTAIQWSANEIDVRTPKHDNNETQIAVKTYAKKLANVKYYEAKLSKSAELKEKALTNKQIKFLEEKGIDKDTYKKQQEIDKIKSMFESSKKLRKSEKSAFIYEVQKQLVKEGYAIKTDGLFLQETSDAIKAFEEKNGLFADGKLDVLTVDKLIK